VQGKPEGILEDMLVDMVEGSMAQRGWVYFCTGHWLPKGKIKSVATKE